MFISLVYIIHLYYNARYKNIMFLQALTHLIRVSALSYHLQGSYTKFL